jgi:hypothetical protein
MRTVCNVTTTVNSFPQRLPRGYASVPARVEVVNALHRMLDALVREPRTLVVDDSAQVSKFNALLQDVKEQFRAFDILRLIDPLPLDASVASVAVRLSIVKRTIDGELARSARSSAFSSDDARH